MIGKGVSKLGEYDEMDERYYNILQELEQAIEELEKEKDNG